MPLFCCGKGSVEIDENKRPKDKGDDTNNNTTTDFTTTDQTTTADETTTTDPREVKEQWERQ